MTHILYVYNVYDIYNIHVNHQENMLIRFIVYIHTYKLQQCLHYDVDKVKDMLDCNDNANSTVITGLTSTEDAHRF